MYRAPNILDFGRNMSHRAFRWQLLQNVQCRNGLQLDHHLQPPTHRLEKRSGSTLTQVMIIHLVNCSVLTRHCSEFASGLSRCYIPKPSQEGFERQQKRKIYKIHKNYKIFKMLVICISSALETFVSPVSLGLFSCCYYVIAVD